MPDIWHEVEEGFGHLLHGHHHDSQQLSQPSPQSTVTIKAATAAAHPGGISMSLAQIAKVADEIGKYSIEALTDIDAILANPVAAAILHDIAGLVGVGVSDSTLTAVGAAGKELLALFQAAPAPASAAPVAQAPAAATPA